MTTSTHARVTRVGGGSWPRAAARAMALAGVAVATLGHPAIVGADTPARRHVEALSTDRLEGRLTGSAGAHLAADYIVEQLIAIGARPLPGQEDFRLPFEFTAGIDDTGSTLQLDHASGEPGRAWQRAEAVQALPFSDAAQVSGPVVFAGYGLTVPGTQGFAYDSYMGLDVEDKIVVVLRYFPEDVDQETRAVLARYSGLRYKALAARERGARALLVVAGPRSPNAGETIPLTFDSASSSSGIVAASIGGDVAEALFGSRAEDAATLDEVQASLDTGNPHVTGFEIPGVEATVDIRLERQRRTAYNVAGYLPGEATAGATTHDRQYVMLGAHYDHLGHGTQGSSLARDAEHGRIHNGADDNASGVAAVLAAGAQLASVDRRRDVVFALWSGEELGLLGSAAFVQHPPLPITACTAYLNFDMVGRMRDNRLTLQAVGTSPIWPRLVEQVNVPIGFDIQIQPDPYLPTDVSSLNQAEVPSLNFFTGSHEDYHRPTDVASSINYTDLERVARFGALLAHRLSNLEEAPRFTTVERTTQAGPGRDTVRAYTGTIPDYTTEVEGLRLSGVVEGGPAAEAGLREGDVIVELAGQQITNIYDYTYALDAVKIDEAAEVVFERDGERRTTTITPRARR